MCSLFVLKGVITGLGDQFVAQQQQQQQPQKQQNNNKNSSNKKLVPSFPTEHHTNVFCSPPFGFVPFDRRCFRHRQHSLGSMKGMFSLPGRHEDVQKGKPS